ncbi:MAG TPA: PQQ-binding-like beta-propeller repeat protein [Gammaproteobacteria bacterium]|jgi:hypothetical protein
MSRSSIALLSLSFLAACGGGSGSGSGSPTSTLKLTASPSHFTGTLVQGLVSQYQITGAATGSTTGNVFQLLTDDGGTFADLRVDADLGNGDFQAHFDNRDDLPVGGRKGNLKLQFCADAACAKVYTSFTISYEFEVLAAKHLTSLSPLAGAADWQTDQGGVGHTGYVPVTLHASDFTPRWLTKVSRDAGCSGYAEAVTDSSLQRVYIKGTQSNGQGSGISAYDETDGSRAWTRNIGSDGCTPFDPLGNPGVFNHVVYAAYGVQSSSIGEKLYGLDAQTGSVVLTGGSFGTCFNGCAPGAPVVAGTSLFVGFGSAGTCAHVNGAGGEPVVAVDTGTGNELWNSPTVSGCGVSPALDGTDLYYYVPGKASDGFTAVDQATGTLAFSVPRVFAGEGGTAALDGNGGALVAIDSGLADGTLERVDLASHARDWQNTGGDGDQLAVAQGVVYGCNDIVSPTVMEAHSLSTGKVVWAWQPSVTDTAGDCRGAIVTKDLLFVSTAERVYAVDLKTHTSVWSYPLGGTLSISPSGILYILGAHMLAAVNLH